jgi:hypothetical protein
MMKLTHAQKRLLLDTYNNKTRNGFPIAVANTFEPALTLAEIGYVTMTSSGAATTFLELTEEGEKAAVSVSLCANPRVKR